jgi:transposase
MRLTFVWRPSVLRRLAAPKPQHPDEQRAVIEDLFPWGPPSASGGRPRVPPRPCLEGIPWVLRTGARRKDLPRSFPP